MGVGVVGLGRISPRHIDDSIKQLKELKLVAVCDVRPNVSEAVGKKEKVAFYTDYKKLIADPAVDVVAVCVPNGFHFEVGMAVAKKNKHCVMEKPIAIDYEKAKKLIKAFEKSKGRLFPVLQVRYNPAVQALYQAVKNNYLGKIYSAALIIRWTRPPEYFKGSDWKGTKRLDGGSLMTQAIHYIDVMQYVLGHAKSVFGKLDQKAHQTETEDMANAVIDFESGARGNLEFTINTYPHNLECSLTVLGEKGTIKVGGNAVNKIELWEVENVPSPSIGNGINPDYTGGMYVGSSPHHQLIYKNLIDVLLYKKPSFIQAKDALESLRIIDGIKKSDKLKKEIKL